MCTVPGRVYFIAVVFALSTVYVSQEAGMAFAKDDFSSPQESRGGEQRDFRPMPPAQMPAQNGDQREDFRPEGPRKDGPRPDNSQMGNPVKGNPSTEARPMGDQQKDSQQFGQPGQMGKEQKFDDRRMMGPQNPQQGQDQKTNDDFDKQQQQMDARRAQQMQQQFSQMKKQFGQMGKMLTQVEARVAALEKQGVKAPADVTEALANAKTALATVQNAQSMDDPGVQDAMDTLRESGQTLGDGMRQLQMLSQMPVALKQAASAIKKLEASYTRSQKAASRLKIDVSGQLSDFRKAIDDIEAGYANAQQLVQSGDAEGAMDTLKSDVFENMQDAMQYPSIIEAIGNVRKSLSGFDKFMARAAKSRAVTADAEASAALAEMRTKVADLKQLSADKTADAEDLHSSVNDIFDLQQTIQDAMGGTQSQSAPQFKQDTNTNFDFSAFGQMNGKEGQP